MNPQPPKTNIFNRSVASMVEEAKEIEAKKETKKESPKFRVANFAYQFKTGASTPLVAIDGIYSPRSEAEKEFLLHQVSQGRISFS